MKQHSISIPIKIAVLAAVSATAGCGPDVPARDNGNEPPAIEVDTTVSASPTDTLSVTPYTNEDLGFRLTIPKRATVEPEGENRIKITFLGPNNAPATEITDGFTLTVVHDPSVAYDDARAYAESLMEQVGTADREVISGIEEVELGGETAYHYQVRSVLDTVVGVYVLLPGTGDGYQLYTGISGSGYDDMVARMLESISFV